MNKKEMIKMRKNVKEIQKPYVMKNDKSLFIIYQGRVEIYELKRVETKKEIDEENGECCYDYEEIYGKGWNKEHEYEMNKGNGYKNVGLKNNGEEEDY